jgi:cytochrome P450
MALGVMGFIVALGPLFFDSANATLASSTTPAAQTVMVLAQWHRWHAVRLAMALTAAAATVMALKQATERRAYGFPSVATAMAALTFGSFAGTLVLTSVFASIWRRSAPADFFSWFSANCDRINNVLFRVAAATLVAVVVAIFVERAAGSRRRISLGLAFGCWGAIFLQNFLFFNDANAALKAATVPLAELPGLLSMWENWNWMRLTLALSGFAAALWALCPKGLAPVQLPLAEPTVPTFPNDGHYRSIQEAAAGLTALEARLAATRDRRGVCMTMYAGMLPVLLRYIDEGRFRDPVWLNRYAVTLANLCHWSFTACDSGASQAAPECWRIAFEAADQSGGAVTYDILLSLNAHIMHDHVQALTAAGLSENWPERHFDYLLLNDVLREASSDVQSLLARRYGRGIGALRFLLRSFETWVTQSMMEFLRDRAWIWATAIADANCASARGLLLAKLEGVTTQTARALAEKRQAGDLPVVIIRVLEGSDAKRLPPGNFGLPWLGQTVAFALNPVEFLASKYRQMGQIFRFRMLGQDLIAVVGPDAFSQLSGPDRERYFARRDANFRPWRELMGGETIAHSDGADRRRRKGLVLQALSPKVVAECLPLVERAIRRRAERWCRLGSFGWVAELQQLSLSLCEALFLAEPIAEEELRDTSAYDALYQALASVPIALPFTTYGRAMATRADIFRRVARRVAEGDFGDGPSVLRALCEAQDADGRGLTAEEICTETMQMIFGTYGALYSSWSCLGLALGRLPEITTRARAEVDQVVGASALKMSILERLPFLLMVTREVRRIYPLTPNTLFSRVIHPFVFMSYRIPVGLKIIGCIDATQRSEPFVSHPDQFDPERFLVKAMAVWDSYVAHGGGLPEQHRCPGELLADTVLVALGAVVLSDWEFELPAQDFGINPRGIATPRGGLQVSFRARAKG